MRSTIADGIIVLNNFPILANLDVTRVSTVTESIEQSPGDRDDAKLVAAARRGELSAFDTLVTRYQRQATSVAYRLLNNMDDALEVSQDAFLRAYEKLASLDKSERFGPWLLRIVSNLALNKRRSRALRRGMSLDAGGDEDDGPMQPVDKSAVAPDEAASAADVRRLMNEAIAELPDMQRKALVMFCIEQLPQKEIAQTLQCSVEAVKWHVFTARKKLKERLKDYM
jgi:RNA polymerase sigma-70 factor (ECF subfamily)